MIKGSRVAQLGIGKVNTYRLEPMPGDNESLLCRLFLEEEPANDGTHKVQNQYSSKICDLHDVDGSSASFPEPTPPIA